MTSTRRAQLDGRSLNLILFGPPGSGKGTQAEYLRDRYGIVQISTGELMRAEVRAETSLGVKIREYMDRGELVPDDISLQLLERRLCEPDTASGFLLDGFPRTVFQAQQLDELLAFQGRRLDRVLYIRVPLDLLIQRLSGRLTCPTCGHTYHPVLNPPRVEGICDRDGGELFMRDDDGPQVARDRISVYMRETLPVLTYYRECGCVSHVEGEGTIEQVSRRIVRTLREERVGVLP